MLEEITDLGSVLEPTLLSSKKGNILYFSDISFKLDKLKKCFFLINLKVFDELLKTSSFKCFCRVLLKVKGETVCEHIDTEPIH